MVWYIAILLIYQLTSIIGEYLMKKPLPTITFKLEEADKWRIPLCTLIGAIMANIFAIPTLALMIANFMIAIAYINYFGDKHKFIYIVLFAIIHSAIVFLLQDGSRELSQVDSIILTFVSTGIYIVLAFASATFHKNPQTL